MNSWRIRRARRRLELVRRRVGLAHPQVLLDGAVEEVGVLAHDGDQAAELVERERRARRARRSARVPARDRRSAAAGARPSTCPRRSARRRRRARPRATVKLEAVVRGTPPARIAEASRPRTSTVGVERDRRGRRSAAAGRARAASRRAARRCPARRQMPSMPWCRSTRSSRSGRNTSTPSMRTIKSAPQRHLARLHAEGAPAERHRGARRRSPCR